MEQGQQWEQRQQEQSVYRQCVLRNGFIPWLVPLDLKTFVTLTFDHNVHPERGDRIFGKWLRIFGRKVPWAMYGVRASERTARWWLHYHLLMEGLLPSERISVAEVRGLLALAKATWQEVGGGFSKWGPVTTSRIAYTCKYVVKGGELDPFGRWPEEPHWRETGLLRPAMWELLDYSALTVHEGDDCLGCIVGGIPKTDGVGSPVARTEDIGGKVDPSSHQGSTSGLRGQGEALTRRAGASVHVSSGIVSAYGCRGTRPCRPDQPRLETT